MNTTGTSWNKGKHWSEEHRLRLSEIHKKLGTLPPSNKGQKHSLETRMKMSLKARGENNYFWKGGIHPINLRIKKSLQYKLWREAVFIRDDYTCVWCDQVGGKLNADHIKPFAHYPELRFDLSNGRTLCEPCHRKTDTFGGRANRKQ